MKAHRFLSFLLILILLLSLSPVAFAAVEFSEDSTITGEHDATVFLAGSSPVSEARVHGILFAAGNSVSAGGESEYVFAAGITAALNGTCSRDAFIAGNMVSFSGNVGRDLLIAGNSLDLSGSVGRDLYAGGKSIVIRGEIGGDAFLRAEQIQIAEGATIGGVLRYNSDAKINGPADILAAASVYVDEEADVPAPVSISVSDSAPASDAAPVSDSTSVPTPTSVPAPSAVSRPSPLAKIKSVAFGYLGLVLIAFALLWLTPLWEKLDSTYTGADFGKYAASFGIGFAVLAALPVAAILLMISGIGLRPAFVLLLLYAAAIIAAPIFFGFFIGVLIWRQLLKRPVNYWAELPIGLLAWRILSLIPGVKTVVSLVCVPLALGVLTRLLGKKKAVPAAPVLPEKTPAADL